MKLCIMMGYYGYWKPIFEQHLTLLSSQNDYAKEKSANISLKKYFVSHERKKVSHVFSQETIFNKAYVKHSFQNCNYPSCDGI